MTTTVMKRAMTTRLKTHKPNKRQRQRHKTMILCRHDNEQHTRDNNDYNHDSYHNDRDNYHDSAQLEEMSVYCGWRPGPEHCGCLKDGPRQTRHVVDGKRFDTSEQLPPWRRHKQQQQHANTDKHECTLRCAHPNITTCERRCRHERTLQYAHTTTNNTVHNHHNIWLKPSVNVGELNCIGPQSSRGTEVHCSSSSFRQSSQSQGCATCANCVNPFGLSVDSVQCLCTHECASCGDDGREVMSPTQESPATKLLIARRPLC